MKGPLSNLNTLTANVGMQMGADPQDIASLQQDIQDISQFPGGTDLLFTEAARQMEAPQQVRLYSMGGYAEGGLSQAAEMTRQGGRNEDDVLLHLSPDEFDILQSMWGQPDVNPVTGMPEYGFLSKVAKKVKSAVKKIASNPVFQVAAPILLSGFLPGAGSLMGSALRGAAISGGVAGLGGARSKDLLRAAALGGVGGGIGYKMNQPNVPPVAEEVATANPVLDMSAPPPTQTVATPQALQGNASTFDDAAWFDAQSVLPATSPDDLLMQSDLGLNTKFGPGTVESGLDPFAKGLTSSGLSRTSPSWGSNALKYGGYGLAGLTALNMLSPQEPQNVDVNESDYEPDPSFFKTLPEMRYNRQYNAPSSNVDWYGYGRTDYNTPGVNFYTGNSTFSDLVYDPVVGDYVTQEELDARKAESASTVMAAQGGFMPGYSMGGQRTQHYYEGGGSGRDDTIDALLSDGEYVMDAETVALLGDGSSKEGAKRLDDMRANLRKHKAQKMMKGGFSHDAKSPLEYLRSQRG